MQTSPSNISLQSKHIQLYLSSELSEMAPFRVSQYLVVLICLTLLIGILCAAGMSIFSSYTTTHGPLRASIHAEVGIVFLLRSESNVRIRLLPGSSTLVSSGDQIDARRGRVTVTHFDGSVQTIDGANVTFMAPPSSVSQEPASETPAWLKRLWNHVDQPHSYPNAASVLG